MNRIFSVTVLVIMLVFAGLDGYAQAGGDVTSELTAFKVIKDAKGNETFEDTASGKPGDLIEYRVRYTNKRKDAIVNLKPLLPVPVGMTYVNNSANPKLSAVSIATGGALLPFPPQRKVKNAQGKEVNEAVPAEEFRSLQWTVSKLNAGASVTLKARVTINKN